MKFIESNSFDPFYNLSFEEYIFKNMLLDGGEEYISLWQNAPSVIIGKNQNAWAEINENFLENNDIKLVRRITGGGAVYHDLGNLNFSFVTNDKGGGRIDFKSYYQPIVKALRTLGVPAELSGRNDVTVCGRKVIGASQSIWRGRVLSNGCILFDVRMERLVSALNVRPEKLQSKGVESVRARVANIKPYIGEDVTVSDFKRMLMNEIFWEFGSEPAEYILTDEDLRGIEKIKSERFGRREWNWGRSPKGSYSRARKFAYGFVEANFDVSGGKIKDLVIQGDFFGKEDIAQLSAALCGIEYEKAAVSDALSAVDIGAYLGAEAAVGDMMALLFDS